MRVIITRNMTVANGKGEAQAFEKSDEPITLDDVETYHRLNRAGAAYVAPDDETAEASKPGPVGVAEMTVTHDEDGKPNAGGGTEILDLKALNESDLKGDSNVDLKNLNETDLQSGENVDLEKLNKTDLVSYADKHGVTVDSGDTKAEIIEKIKAAKAA